MRMLVFRDTTVPPKLRLTGKDRWRHQGRGYMRRFTRLTVLACAAALALAVVALAAASYTPSMGIFQATYKPSGSGAVTVVVAQEKADDPTARIVIYTPLGYKA